MDEPFNAFPAWFLRVECDRCGKLRMLNQTHMRGSDMPIRDIIGRMRHDICGGGAGKAELLTGIEGAPAAARYAGSVLGEGTNCRPARN